MSVYDKPLPLVNADSQKYWDGCKQHKLFIQKCGDCGEYIFYPRSVCPKCMSMSIDWVQASGRGKIYSYTTVWRAPTEEFNDNVPYTIILVDLAENVRMLSWIIDCKPEDVAIGMEVEVVFDDVTDEVTLPKFRPVI